MERERSEQKHRFYVPEYYANNDRKFVVVNIVYTGNWICTDIIMLELKTAKKIQITYDRALQWLANGQLKEWVPELEFVK